MSRCMSMTHCHCITAKNIYNLLRLYVNNMCFGLFHASSRRVQTFVLSFVYMMLGTPITITSQVRTTNAIYSHKSQLLMRRKKLSNFQRPLIVAPYKCLFFERVHETDTKQLFLCVIRGQLRNRSEYSNIRISVRLGSIL